MSARQSRRKRSRRSSAVRRLLASFDGVIEHPLRAGFVGVLSLAAMWLVLTKSLPYALAPKQPDAALALNPKNPAALVAKAEAVKRKLAAVLGAEAESAKAVRRGGTPDESANTLSRLPEANGARVEAVGEREKLRGEIRDLALRAIASEPLNAQAFRLLAEVTNGADPARMLMKELLRRSRREAIAAFWLLNDSVYRKDFQSAVYYSDILLRTQPPLLTYVLNYLSLIAEAPEARPLLVEKLEADPAWRYPFFASLPETARTLDAPLSLMAALRTSTKPPSPKELLPYLNFLIRTNRVDIAYNLWLQSLPASQTASMEFLTNAKFQDKPSGVPFDWLIQGGTNALAEIVPSEGGGARNVLHVSFSDGRVKFPQVEQILLLPHGRYRLEGKLRGAVLGKRGLRWRLVCLNGPQQVIGETEMLLGKTDEWRVFSFEAEIPQSSECIGQTLRLIHDARSASEELVSGEVWFDDLSLERAPSESAGWTPDH